MIQVTDDPHVAKHVGIPRGIEAETVLKAQDIANRLATVEHGVAIEDAAAMVGMDHRDLHPAEIDCATLIHAQRVLHAFAREPGGDLKYANHLFRLRLLRDRNSVANVIAVAMSDYHRVKLANLLLVGGAGRIVLYPWVD